MREKLRMRQVVGRLKSEGLLLVGTYTIISGSTDEGAFK